MADNSPSPRTQSESEDSARGRVHAIIANIRGNAL